MFLFKKPDSSRNLLVNFRVNRYYQWLKRKMTEPSDIVFDVKALCRQQLQPWYIIKTKAHSEELARNSLGQYGIVSYLPQLLTNNSKHQTLKNVPLFPGYMFFQLELESQYWPYIRWAPGVCYILKDDQGPTPIPAELVNELKVRELEQHERKRQQVKEPYKPKERLKVTTGPFAGLEAVFEKPLSANGRVQVLIEILGQVTRINLEKAALSRG